MNNKQYNGGRVEDAEILFVTLLLMFGEPPIPPILHAGLDAQRRYVAKNVNYGMRIKDMMGELEHNPHQGLYGEYMHWCKENWNAKQRQSKVPKAKTHPA